MINVLRFIWHLPRNAAIGLVRIYQKTISPDHSFWGKAVFTEGFCRFSPTCSEYMCQSLKKHGLILGMPKGLWRILRCNPWSDGGEDRA